MTATSEFAEFHDELRSVARDLLGATAATGRHDAQAVPLGWELVARSGWLGLEVAEHLGGAGATFAEVAVVLHEMGRAATASAFLGTAVLGVGALRLVEPSRRRDGLLRRVAAGDARVAVALAEAPDAPARGAPPFRLTTAGGGFRLQGRCEFVIDAADADALLVVALDPEHRVVLVEVPPGARGVELTSQPVLDATRGFGTVTARGVDVETTSVLAFEAEAGDVTQQLFDRAAVAIACDSLGAAEAMLDATVAYASQRHQFGRPIGSFQAVKHACADMAVQVAVGRELVAAAVEHVTEPARRSRRAAEVSMAKAYVSAAAVDVVGAAMQLHGGIGYTWESGIHLYLKRVALNRSLFGSPIAHRARIAERYPDVVARTAPGATGPC